MYEEVTSRNFAGLLKQILWYVHRLVYISCQSLSDTRTSSTLKFEGYLVSLSIRTLYKAQWLPCALHRSAFNNTNTFPTYGFFMILNMILFLSLRSIHKLLAPTDVSVLYELNS